MADYQAPSNAADWSAGTRVATAAGANTQRTIQESANEANALRDEFNANLRKAKKSAVWGDLGTIAGTAAGFLIPGAAPLAGTIGRTVGNLAGSPSASVTGITDLAAGIANKGQFKAGEQRLVDQINERRKYAASGAALQSRPNAYVGPQPGQYNRSYLDRNDRRY